jgi:7,8-dihydropterin-6-yl-methyl-4-(beta-D-ribofuranosyl)aminobenzene 5'-phosphate synthase
MRVEDRWKKNLRLYTGGEDNFCHRVSRNPDGNFVDFGSVLDRSKLKALNVEAVLSEEPIVIEGHAFTTGAVPRISLEHVLPNTDSAPDQVAVQRMPRILCLINIYQNLPT